MERALSELRDSRLARRWKEGGSALCGTNDECGPCTRVRGRNRRTHTTRPCAAGTMVGSGEGKERRQGEGAMGSGSVGECWGVRPGRQRARALMLCTCCTHASAHC